MSSFAMYNTKMTNTTAAIYSGLLADDALASETPIIVVARRDTNTRLVKAHGRIGEAEARCPIFKNFKVTTSYRRTGARCPAF